MGKIITELLKERQKSLYKFRLKIRLAFLFWVMLTNHNAGTNCVLQGQSQCLRLRKKSETVTGNGKCWPQCFTALPRSPEPCQYGSQPKCEMVEDVTTDLEIKMSPWATAGSSMVQKLTDLIFSQLLGRHNGLVYRASPRGPFYNGKVTQWGVTDEAGSEMGWPWCRWGRGCPAARSSASGLASVSGCHQEHIPGFTASATLCATWLVWSLGVLGWAVSKEWASPGCELGGRGAVRLLCGHHLWQWGWAWWSHGPSWGHVWGQKGQTATLWTGMLSCSAAEEQELTQEDLELAHGREAAECW